MKRLYGLFLFLIISSSVNSLEVYVPRVIVRLDEPFRVRDVITAPGGLPSPLGDHILDPQWDSPSLIPLPALRSVMDKVLDKDFVLVGRRPVYIPQGYSEQEVAFFTDVLQILDTVHKDGSELIEIQPLSAHSAYLLGSLEYDTVTLVRTHGRTSEFALNEKGSNQATIPLRVNISRPVLVTTEYVRMGDVLTRENTELVFKEKNTITSGREITSIGAVKNTAARNLPKGITLLEEYLSAKLIVNRGDSVSIIIEKNNIRMEVQGIALESGGLGEGIRVRPLKGMKDIMATVKREGEVKIETL